MLLTEQGYADTRSKAQAIIMSDGVCPMFISRSGSIARTAVELLEHIRTDALCTNEDLADALDQMVRLPVERMDDWSVGVWSRGGLAFPPTETEPVSMLRAENDKWKQA